MARRLTRKAFLGRAGSLALLAAVPSACGGKLAESPPPAATTGTTSTGQLAIFVLSTACTNGSRCACRACEKHAANKVFATQAAADGGRAHAHCNCQVVQGGLPSDTWRTVFGDPDAPSRTAVDRRDPQFQKLLS